MPSSSSERTFARRALIEEIRGDRKSWLRHGVAALAVSVLGLGVAGSVALTGAAQHTTLTATVATTDLAKKTSRAAERGSLDPAKIKSIADQRDEELSKIGAEVSEASMDRSAKARTKALQKLSDSTRRQAILLKRGQASRSDTPLPDASAGASGRGCLPIRRGYSIAAGFGQVGPWSRYHTGLGLLLSGRYPIARSCGRGRHECRDRIGERLGRQLCRNQAREWHAHTDGPHVRRQSQGGPDCVGLPDRRHRWA